jgi:type II secretory pathway pseudopilin PulG
VEIVVALALVGILAAVIGQALAGYAAAQRARTTSEVFTSLGYSLNNGNNPLRNSLSSKGFINSVVDLSLKAAPYGRYPSRLSQLVVAITTNDADCAGTKYDATKVAAWTANAPFSDLLITLGVGVTTPMGTIRDSVFPGTGNTANLVEMRLDSVTTQDAENLDFSVDNQYDSAAGQLRYMQSGAGPTRPNLHLIKYVMPAFTGC